MVRGECHMIRYICDVNQTETDVVTVVGFDIKGAVTPNEISHKIRCIIMLTSIYVFIKTSRADPRNFYYGCSIVRLLLTNILWKFQSATRDPVVVVNLL